MVIVGGMDAIHMCVSINRFLIEDRYVRKTVEICDRKN